MTSVAQVVYERYYAGANKSNKNTFVDLMAERVNALAGVKKKGTEEENPFDNMDTTL